MESRGSKGRVFFGPTARGPRLRTVFLPILLVVVAFAGILLVLAHGHTSGNDSNRSPATLFVLFSRDGLTSVDHKADFALAPGSTTENVAFIRNNVRVLCTVTTGENPADVQSDCRTP